MLIWKLSLFLFLTLLIIIPDSGFARNILFLNSVILIYITATLLDHSTLVPKPNDFHQVFLKDTVYYLLTQQQHTTKEVEYLRDNKITEIK